MYFADQLWRNADENGSLSVAVVAAALQAHGFTLNEWLRDAQLYALNQDSCGALLNWLGY